MNDSDARETSDPDDADGVLAEIIRATKIRTVRRILDAEGIVGASFYHYLKPNVQTGEIYVLGSTDEYAAMRIQQALSADPAEDFVRVLRMRLGDSWAVAFMNEGVQEQKRAVLPEEKDPELAANGLGPHAERLAQRAQTLRDVLSEHSINQITEYSSIDLVHELGGIEVCGIHDIETTVQVQQIMLAHTGFPYSYRIQNESHRIEQRFEVCAYTQFDAVRERQMPRHDLVDTDPEEIIAYLKSDEGRHHTEPRFFETITEELDLRIGYGLIGCLDTTRGGTLFEELKNLRELLARCGVHLPLVHLRDNMQLPTLDFTLAFNGHRVRAQNEHLDFLDVKGLTATMIKAIEEMVLQYQE